MLRLSHLIRVAGRPISALAHFPSDSVIYLSTTTPVNTLLTPDVAAVTVSSDAPTVTSSAPAPAAPLGGQTGGAILLRKLPFWSTVEPPALDEEPDLVRPRITQELSTRVSRTAEERDEEEREDLEVLGLL